MFKKYIVGFLGLGIFITVHAHNFSKSNEEIIALSKVYQKSAEELLKFKLMPDALNLYQMVLSF